LGRPNERIDTLLQGLPDKTDFIRQAVLEKLERDSAAQVQVEVEVEVGAIAPKVAPISTKKRRRSFDG